jgi:alkylation response protein AidB-like acyl-CoA dehydrogenase
MFGLFRTDPDSERHRGLSFLLVPLDAPGVTVRPIEKLNHKAAFAEVFFDDARVPADGLLGQAGQGWNVAMSTAGFERGLMLRSPARFQATAAKLVALYRENAESCDAVLRQRVVDGWLRAEAYTLETYRTVSRLLSGGKIGAEASLNKIFWSELDLELHETALEILGWRAELLPGAPAARGVGEWLDGFLFALAGPIYAGTNEIQRNVIAERLLGLPR